MKNWKTEYSAVPISSAQEMNELLKHKVDVVWLWDDRFHIFDHNTKMNYIFSSTEYPKGDNILYKVSQSLIEVCKAENMECGRSKLENSLVTGYFPSLISYAKEHNLK